MDMYKNKKNKNWFAFLVGYHSFLISEDGFCLVDFKECDFIFLEEYEILFDKDIDYILNNINKLMHTCDACMSLKNCLKYYKFLEEKEELFNYLEELKKTKRIGEFAEE